MDNAFKMRRQYASIEVQIKSVSLLIDEISTLSEEVATKILDEVNDLTLGEIESRYPDFSSLDDYKALWIIGKKFGQGMSELRSALDYLVRFLAYANGNTPYRRSEFPVVDRLNQPPPAECRIDRCCEIVYEHGLCLNHLQEEQEGFLSRKCLHGLTCDQKKSIRLIQPAYTSMHWQAETLSAVNLHRHTYMHNFIPFIAPYLVPYPSFKDRRCMDDNGPRIKHDPNSKIKAAGFEVWVYKEDLWRLEKVMVRSRLYGEPSKLLSDHRKTIIGIMQQLTSAVDTDPKFDFEFPGAPYQSNP